MRSLVEDLLAQVHEAVEPDRSGDILRGIAPLEDVDPEKLGLCLATADGHVYEYGDTRLPFCVQSISKAFTYGLALTDCGHEAVDAKIDQEPSGDAFNEISLDPSTHRPRNPMINAGAIVAASMVRGVGPHEKSARVAERYAAFAGRELPIAEDVFEAESHDGHRNMAIAHLLKEFEILDCEPEVALEVYLRQCSTLVECRDLALMGATLANEGVNPVTGQKVINQPCNERVLSVMLTCGMYDFAGEWVAEVGLSAKSGVGGGIVAVLPGQLSLAVFSPRLDQHGNSVRAIEACRRLSRELELHVMHVPRAAQSAVRDSYDIVEAPSSLQRPQADWEVLAEHGHRARVYEVHGDLMFAGAESVLREISESADDLELVVLDVRSTDEVADVSRRLLGGLRASMADEGCKVVLVDPGHILPGGHDDDRAFPSLAAAITWCEDVLLERYGEGSRRTIRDFAMDEHPVIEGITDEHAQELRRVMEVRDFDDGETILERGDERAGMFLILSGRVRSWVDTASHGPRTVAILAAGSTFGQVHLATDRPHSLTYEADGDVRAAELTREAFDRIHAEDEGLYGALLRMMMFALSDDLDRALRVVTRGRVAPTGS